MATFSMMCARPYRCPGYLQLYAVAESDEERDECVAAATERLGAMRVLVDQLFEYAKAVSDDRALTREPVDVADVLGSAGRAVPLSSSAAGRGGGRRGRGSVADREALTRIVENVLGTAPRQRGPHRAAELLIRVLRYAAPSTRRRDGRCSGFALDFNEAEGWRLDRPRLSSVCRGDAARSTGGSGLGLPSPPIWSRHGHEPRRQRCRMAASPSRFGDRDTAFAALASAAARRW
ncbi:MAG: hypothetical protein ACLSVD_07740 [Eggerthellaceae bacterium]